MTVKRIMAPAATDRAIVGNAQFRAPSRGRGVASTVTRARQCGHMIRKLLLAALSMTVALVGTVAILYLLNAPPAMPTLSAADAAASSKPYVVKLHAQWCPYCLLTKDEWSQIEQTYAGRVHLVVLDFTSEAATERSRAEAQRLNLGPFFDEYAGATGIVVVLDGRTLEVKAEIGGNRPFEDYRAAIDAALATTSPIDRAGRQSP